MVANQSLPFTRGEFPGSKAMSLGLYETAFVIQVLSWDVYATTLETPIIVGSFGAYFDLNRPSLR